MLCRLREFSLAIVILHTGNITHAFHNLEAMYLILSTVFANNQNGGCHEQIRQQICSERTDGRLRGGEGVGVSTCMK